MMLDVRGPFSVEQSQNAKSLEMPCWKGLGPIPTWGVLHNRTSTMFVAARNSYWLV